MADLILYACPTGALADAIEGYWRRVRSAVGSNSAHHYMPHVTLTGFFHDTPASITDHLAVLDHLIASSPPPAPAAVVTGALFHDDFHLLTVESAWCQEIAQAFRDLATASRPDAIRPKEWLHISLAYGFAPDDGAALERMGREMVDPTLPARWELRFYERVAPGEWRAHATWPLQPLDGSG